MVAAKSKRKQLCIHCKKRKQFSRKVCQACLRAATDLIASGEKTDEALVAEGYYAPRKAIGRPRTLKPKVASRKSRTRQ